MAVEIGRVNARVSYEITPEDEADPGARTHASGRLDLILYELFRQWECGEIDDARIHVGDVTVPPDATREVFEAMLRVKRDA